MEKKIKVALMSYAMDNRSAKGTALYTRKLVERLLDDEHFEFYLVHFDRVGDPLYAKAREIIMPELKLPFATRFARTMLFFWKYRNDQFDIIHWFQPRLYPFFWFAPARHIVVTAHGAGDITAGGKFPFSRRVFNFLMRHFNAQIDAIIGDSEFGRQEIIEWYRVASERVHAIYLGGAEEYRPLDKETAQQRIKERYGISSPFILDISRHVAHKNIPTLIRAYAQVQQEGSNVPKLVVVGFRSFAYEAAQAEAQRVPRPADILFIDYIAPEDLNALYAAAEIFVFPSLNEGFGLPIVEAFASGTPVITSEATSMPEIAGDAALLVNPQDEADIAQKIKNLLDDPLLHEQFRQSGLERARKFRWSETAKDTAVLYQRIAGQ